MDEQFLNIIREVGPIGIIALALLGMSRTIRPAIESIATAQRDGADARREQSETNKAVIRRWEESDKALEINRREHVTALQMVSERLEKLDITDSQRIKQNDVAHALQLAMTDKVTALPRIFEAGKDDAVTQVKQAMDNKLDPIERRLAAIETLLHEVRDLVNPRQSLPTQEHHHTGNVTMTPAAPEQPAAPLEITGDVTVHQAEDDKTEDTSE